MTDDLSNLARLDNIASCWMKRTLMMHKIKLLSTRARHQSRRRLLACGATALLAMGHALPARANDKVVFGWLPATDQLPFYIAMEEKAFEAVGIDVVQQKFTAPNQLVDAMIADKVDVGPFGTAPGIALIAESQIPGSLKLFGLSGGELGTPYVNSMLLARSGSGIHSIADLRGKRVGVLPSIQWKTAVRFILKKEGLNPDTDVRLTELAFPVQIPALKAGSIDALVAIEPFGSIGVASGDIDPVIVNLGARYVANPFWGGCAVMTTKFIQERPEVARKVMLVLRDMVTKLQANFDAYKPLLAKYSGVSESALPVVKQLLFRDDEQITASDIAALQKFVDMLHDQGVVAGSMDAASKIIRLSDLK
jgi:NitT/TauT family transport system substrate-binding protein